MSRNEKPKGFARRANRKVARSKRDAKEDRKASDAPLDLLALAKVLASDIGLWEKDLCTIENRVRSEGISFLRKTMPSLGKALDKGLGSGVFKLPSAFKRKHRGSEIPAFGGSLFSQLFLDNGAIKSHISSALVARLRTFLFFFYKVETPFEDKQVGEVISRFLENEYQLHQSFAGCDDLNHLNDPVLKGARKLAAEVFENFDISSLRPRHGPGVVSNAPTFEKWECPVESTYDFLNRYRDFFFLNEVDRESNRRPQRVLIRKNRAKVICVPKDSRGPRLISAEPVEHQFIQQGLMKYMVETLESHPLTKGHVNFRDQGVNQSMALKTSVNKVFATLDLKDASDLVSNPLVRTIFADTPLLEHLMLTRSEETVLPDGSVVPLKKFAPMGSAVCFPVEAFVFYSLILSSMLAAGISRSLASRLIYVYGDDIIVYGGFAPIAVEVLERYRLKVNKDKSFIKQPFAESCGYDCYNGDVVTPIRLRKCTSISSDPQSAASYVSTATQLETYGLHATSEYLYSFVESYLGRLPYGTDTSPYLNRRVPKDIAHYLNQKEGRVRKKKSKTSPGGFTFYAWSLRSLSIDRDEDGFAYMHRKMHCKNSVPLDTVSRQPLLFNREETMRYLESISEDFISYGRFGLRKRVVLRRKRYSLYDCS